MIDTPKTFWKPAANTSSHRLGRTTAETRRPGLVDELHHLAARDGQETRERRA